MRKLCNILLFAFCLLSFSLSFALETDTHEKINEFIATNNLNGFSLDSYLKNQLGFADGIKEEFKSTTETKKVWEWIKIGGKYEDIPYWYMPYLRSVNHFHNPLTDKGFSGIWGTGFLSGESSIQWSQKPVGTQSPGGYYSWHDVRDYFYKALTSIDKITREKNFSETFRGLGQLMHLVEDLSVPEHTRDDGHYLLYNYEKWVKNNPGIISQYIPIYFDSSAIGNLNPLASVPIANLFDTNQYNGTNPNITIYNNIGLSEYTNSHFLSPDTMFINAFPYPSWSSVVEYDEVIDPTTGKVRTYIKKLGYGEIIDEKIGYGEAIQHLAAGKWFYKYLPPDLKRFGLKLDKTVYADYAKKLIPRAVGYSAGLLNYFFRGDINMLPDNESGYGYVIENNTDEDMSGTFELWYDDKNDERIKIQSWNLNINKKSSGSNKSTNITFTPPADAKEPCKYILVFKGQMGQEQDAVVGKIVNTIECIEGRIVVLHKRSRGILVGTKNGYLQTFLPVDGFNRAVAVRFDVDNPEEFVVLAVYYGEYVFHKFKIDANEGIIRYEGIVGPKIKVYSYERVPSGFRHVCCEVFKWEEFEEYSENWIIIDFYLKGNLIKPFGYFLRWHSHGLSIDPGDGVMIEATLTQGIYFGIPVIERTSHCPDGYLSIISAVGDGYNDPKYCPPNDQWWDRCYIDYDAKICSWTEEPSTVWPIAIFNESDYAYIELSPTGKWEVKSTLPIQMPQTIASNLYITTMLRKDGKYSFCTRDPYNKGLPKKSYSSEIGVVDCSGFLIGGNNIGWRVEPWSAEVVRFNDCSDWERLFSVWRPYLYEDYIYDVSLSY